MSTKPSVSGSQNMLGELQKELIQEEAGNSLSSKLIKPVEEESKQELPVVQDSQLITEEIKE